jgi:sucrose phosphorylase
MKDDTGSIGPKLSKILRQIYPELDGDILASLVIEAFWPEGTARRKRGRVPGNTLWSQKDALLIT